MVEAPAVPAPVVVAPPEVVNGKDGKPVKAPKICTQSDLDAIAKKVAESMDQYMKSLPADTTPDPYADIPVFATPTSDVLTKQGV